MSRSYIISEYLTRHHLIILIYSDISLSHRRASCHVSYRTGCSQADMMALKVCKSYCNSSSVCLSVCTLSPPRSFDGSSPNLVGVCRWTSELPLRGSFSKRSTGRRVNRSLSLSTILYMHQPQAIQVQFAAAKSLIRAKGALLDG